MDATVQSVMKYCELQTSTAQRAARTRCLNRGREAERGCGGGEHDESSGDESGLLQHKGRGRGARKGRGKRRERDDATGDCRVHTFYLRRDGWLFYTRSSFRFFSFSLHTCYYSPVLVRSIKEYKFEFSFTISRIEKYIL